MAFDARAKLGVVAFAAILLGAALMHSGALRISGVAPNLVLVALVVFSFFSENILFFVVLTLFAGILVRATPAVFDPLATITTMLALLVFLLERRIVWPGLLGTAAMVGLTTLLTYLIIAPGFLLQHPGLIAAELLYNVGIGLVLFEAVNLLVGRSVRNVR